MESSFVFLNHTMPPLALRAVRESLSFVPLGSLRRTVGGALMFVEGPTKFQLKLSGSDVESPSFSALVRGRRVTVHPLHRIWEDVAALRHTLMRPPVLGSVRVQTSDGKDVVFEEHDGVVEATGEGLMVSYRPQLVMRVVDMESTCEEWKNTTQWSLTLEEV